MTGPRVAILLSEGLQSRGGIGRAISYLMRGLARVAPDIPVIALATRMTDASLLKHLSVPASMAAFVRRLVADRIDIVHINVAPRGSTWRKMLYASVARGGGRKVLLHLHGSAYDEYYASLGAARKRLVRNFFQNADGVVVLSENWRQFVVSELAVPEARVTEIANGVPEVDEQTPKGRPEVPCIAFFGILGPRKGTDVLFKALAELDRRDVPWRAVVGGNGDIDAAIAQTRALHIDSKIELLGWVGEDAVDRLLRIADVFVLPSRGENQPVSILEAMARATPVVATRVGAIPRQVLDGQTGILVQPGDPIELADALEKLIRDEDLRLAYGAAGRERFEDNFSASASAEKFAALYRKLMTPV